MPGNFFSCNGFLQIRGKFIRTPGDWAGFEGNSNAGSVDTHVGFGSDPHPLVDRRSAWDLGWRCDNSGTAGSLRVPDATAAVAPERPGLASRAQGRKRRPTL